MKMQKWTTPQLMVLEKGQPEENVLEQCKSVHSPPNTATSGGLTGQNCKAHPKNPGICSTCQAEGGGAS
jgi:hypothetical protein